jgi:hypothetical protein
MFTPVKNRAGVQLMPKVTLSRLAIRANAQSSKRPCQLLVRLALCAAMLLSQGCANLGADKLLSTHEGYNDAVQLTVSREVLKNIVRLRYYDPMAFMRVTAVNASFSVNVGGNAGRSGIGASGESSQFLGNVGYGESPTITFVPQSDANFNKSMDSPIELSEAIAYIFQRGNYQPYEIGLMITSINDAVDRPGPLGELYQRRVNALLDLGYNGATLRGFREFYPRHVPLDNAKMTALAYALAAQGGFYFYDAGDGKVNIASKHLATGLMLPDPNDPATVEDLKTLGLVPGERLYPVRPPEESEPDTFDEEAKTIWIATRSPESMMELASRTVEVPAEHSANGIAPPQGPASYSTVVLPMTIKSSSSEPYSLYRIEHRGYWYYIDDTDPVSKQLFSTIVDAYTSRIGLKTTEDKVPQLVLPVSGG